MTTSPHHARRRRRRPDPDRPRWRDGRLLVESDTDVEETFRLLETERPVAAGRVLVVMVLGLLLGALLNADRMEERAEEKSFDDPWRGPSLALWGAFDAVADAVGLTQPRKQLEAATGREGTDEGLDVEELLERTDESASPTTTAPPEPRIPDPTATEPLRLYVGGDSIAKNFGLEMQDAAGSTGIIRSWIDYRVVSGLTRPDYFNWPQHLADEVVPTDPQVVILLFGANDAQSIRTEDGSICPRFDQCWIDEYRRRVAGTMDLLRDPAGDRVVLWLGQPVPGPSSGVLYLDLFNGIYAEEAAERPWVHYVDTWSWFQTPDRSYSAYLDAADGTEHRVRDSDDVHFTPAGGARLSWAVLRYIDDRIADLSAWPGTMPVSQLPGNEPPPRDGPPPPEPRLVD